MNMTRVMRGAVLLTAVLCALILFTNGFGYTPALAQVAVATEDATAVPAVQAQPETADGANWFDDWRLYLALILLVGVYGVAKEYFETERSKVYAEPLRAVFSSPVGQAVIPLAAQLLDKTGDALESTARDNTNPHDDASAAALNAKLDEFGQKLMELAGQVETLKPKTNIVAEMDKAIHNDDDPQTP